MMSTVITHTSEPNSRIGSTVDFMMTPLVPADRSSSRSTLRSADIEAAAAAMRALTACSLPRSQ